MSELSKKRVRTSLKAIAQSKRVCILSSSLSERCNHVKFLGGYLLFSIKILPNEPMSHVTGNSIHGPLVSCFPLPSGVEMCAGEHIRQTAEDSDLVQS
jgi:hypothetical protein